MQRQSNQLHLGHEAWNGNGPKQLIYFSSLLGRRVCAGKIKDRLGRLTDLVFSLREPYPEAVGLYLEHGWGKPTQFIPWERVLKIEDDAIFVRPPEEGGAYPPFVDQPGWLLVDAHLIGRTILDLDGRRTEVVNDAHLLEARGRLLLLQVDTSVNGILRRWGLGGFKWIREDLISWKYVQPLSLEDAAASDQVSLSVTRAQLRDLPPEDLADALEELSGQEQQALFSALDSETAADTLMEAEPRAQRQLIASLRRERARTIFEEMSVAQLAALFSVLPHDHSASLLDLLPEETGQRVRHILAAREASAHALLSLDFLTAGPRESVGQVLAKVRGSGLEHHAISYIYVVEPEDLALRGVVDLRELILAPDDAPMAEIMASPVVAAEAEDLHEDLAAIFAKYHYRMVPVLDEQDHILGVITYKEIMTGQTARSQE